MNWHPWKSIHERDPIEIIYVPGAPSRNLSRSTIRAFSQVRHPARRCAHWWRHNSACGCLLQRHSASRADKE